MDDNKPNIKSTIIVCAALVILVGIFSIMYLTLIDKPDKPVNTITLDIVYSDGKTESHTLNTSAEYLEAAIKEAAPDLIRTAADENGTVIISVNGVSADESSSECWRLTKAGEMVNTPIESTPITNGEKFELTLISVVK